MSPHPTHAPTSRPNPPPPPLTKPISPLRSKRLARLIFTPPSLLPPRRTLQLLHHPSPLHICFVARFPVRVHGSLGEVVRARAREGQRAPAVPGETESVCEVYGTSVCEVGAPAAPGGGVRVPGGD